VAANTSKRTQDEEETTDAAGRKHDGRGRFASDEESEGGRGGQNGRSQGSNGQTSQSGSGSQSGGGSKGGRGAQGGQNGGAQKRVLSRAVRVLNEIEARIHELREELEEQGGSGEEGGSGSGRGQVKHPETDGRLKQNREGGGAGEEGEDEEGEEQTGSRGRNGSRR
jgi:hypothetical protein